MPLSTALTYLKENAERFEDELVELLRIPSISYDPAYKADMDKAAAWLADKLLAIGMADVEIMPTDGHSVVYGEWLAARDGASAPTVLIYGHYDVQSPEPLEDWKSKPFEPEIRNDNLYARGASDMKGQILAAVNAVEAILKTGDLPLNVKFLIEGEEEIGSKHLNAFLIANREKLACDFSLNTDAGGMPDADTPSICYSLRGGAKFLLKLFGPRQDIHSGKYGGVIQNPIHVLSKIIADLHDEHGRITLPGFYDRVRMIDEEEHAELAKLPFDEAFILEHSGAPALWGESEYIPAERIGARPAMDVVHFSAGQPKGAIPATASAMLTFRLVPDQDPDEIHRQFRQYLENRVPPTVKWDLQFVTGIHGIIMDRNLPEILAMKNALEVVFEKEPIFQRVGGGIGAVSMFKNVLGINSVLTGFSLSDDNFHGPNEKLHLPTWRKGMKSIVHFLNNIAGTQK
ncbi:MAG TPA: M20/M25/M40 family metallo-hydrolase [Anaerolineales bacterium]|nr:M20/M25/M40 family metallo-hydrolase [Anaerolineales bacterium]